MRTLTALVFFALTACTAIEGDGARAGPGRAPTAPPSVSKSEPRDGGPFAGVWEACEGATSPDQCSRYVLLQRGKRICGTWSYVATGDGYEGRVVAEAASATAARRTRICGRPGSETRTECADGWERIDRPLRLCDGKLGDLESQNGRCFAEFSRVKAPDADSAALANERWVQACLADAALEATP